MRRATVCRQGTAKFSFPSLQALDKSYAGWVTTARLRQTSDQAWAHVSSIHLQRSSTVKSIEGSVKMERR